jgi:hypothetical protein
MPTRKQKKGNNNNPRCSLTNTAINGQRNGWLSQFHMRGFHDGMSQRCAESLCHNQQRFIAFGNARTVIDQYHAILGG